MSSNGIDEHEIVLNANLVNTVKNGKISTDTDITDRSEVEWISSNAKVAQVMPHGNSVTVRAVGGGSARITARAKDGSGKTAVVTVKVIIPVSGISIVPTGANGYSDYIGYGKSVNAKAVLGSTYGVPTVSKVRWDYEPVLFLNARDFESGESYEEKIIPYPNQEELKKKKLVTIAANGRITLAAEKTWETYAPAELIDLSADEYKQYLDNDNWTEFGFIARAYTTDGTGLIAEYPFRCTYPVSDIGVYYWQTVKHSIRYGMYIYKYTTEEWVKQSKDTIILGEQDTYSFPVMSKFTMYDIQKRKNVTNGPWDVRTVATVKSSNARVATGYFNWDDNGVGYLYVVPQKAGTTAFTLYATDGSGKKGTFKITVK